MQLTIIAAIATAILGVAFAMQNNVLVTVNLLLWRFDSSLAMVLLVALALGALIVALLTTPAAMKYRWQQSRAKRRIEKLESICENQRTRIAELESHIPTEVVGKQVPYVGLKTLIVGTPDKTPGPN